MSEKCDLKALDTDFRVLQQDGGNIWVWLKNGLTDSAWSRLGSSLHYAKHAAPLRGPLLSSLHRHVHSLLPPGWEAGAVWIGRIGIPTFTPEQRQGSHCGPCLCVGWRAGPRATLTTGGRRIYINENPILFNTGWGGRISAPAPGGWILLVLAESQHVPEDDAVHEVETHTCARDPATQRETP